MSWYEVGNSFSSPSLSSSLLSRNTANDIFASLAYASLYLGIAKIVSSLDMDLFETKQQDLEVYHTRGFAFPREGSGAVKVRVTGILK